MSRLKTIAMNLSLGMAVVTGALALSPNDASAVGIDLGFKLGAGYTTINNGGLFDFTIDLGCRWDYFAVQLEQTVSYAINSIDTRHGNHAKDHLFGNTLIGIKGLLGGEAFEFSAFAGGGVSYGSKIETSGAVKANLEFLFNKFYSDVWLQFGPYLSYQYNFAGEDHIATGGFLVRFPAIGDNWKRRFYEDE